MTLATALKTTTAVTKTTTPVTTTAIPADKPLITGDITGDGEIGLRDVREALKEYTYTFIELPSILNASQKKAADIDGDGKITLRDVRLILKYYTYNSVSKLDVTWDDVLNEKNQKEE